MSTLIIARLTFREASRRWILWAALVLGLLFLGVYGLGFREIQKDIFRNGRTSQLYAKEIYNFLYITGLYAVNFLTALMTVLTSVDTLSGEISSGTVQTIASKPLHRWEILLGKWLGFTGMLTLYLGLMAGGIVVVTYLVSGYSPPNILRGLSLMWLNITLLLSVSLAGGVTLTTLANGVLVFGLYGVAFLGGWIEQIGSFTNNETAVQIGIVCSLILPSEALWRRASFEMQSPVAAVFGGNPFTSSSVPSPLMVLYAMIYTAAMLAIAVRYFTRRDL